MTIPDDPLNRRWVDLSSVNPARVDELRPALVSFLGFDKMKNPGLAGTGFVLAGNGQSAIIFTAKHVLERLKLIQQPRPWHAPSALFIPSKRSAPILSPKRSKAVWMGQQDATLLNVIYAFYGESSDIACCIVMPSKNDKFSPVSIPLDTRIPSVGDLVHMISLSEMGVSESAPPSSKNGLGQIIKIARTVSIRAGHVTGLYETGLRHYQWPCFTTSIPAEPGMSGGFVCLPESGATVGACGIVCADNSTDKARNNMLHSGESVIACTWPGLGLSVPEDVPYDNKAPKLTIFDMIKTGRMPSANGGIDQFEIIKFEGNNCRVQRRS